MKKIEVLNLFDFTEEIEDCKRIITAFYSYGYEITLEQAYLMWQKLSTDWDAGWLSLPDKNSVIVRILKNTYREIE